ncbi:MAG: hypothetical protein DWQ05_18045 [Calditrichaeota bacterium]|nr:MAG: hypothetical protein DWQ05_18045 [Calditrichota bacterium]
MASSKQTIREGLIVGIIGYGSVALLYAVFDFLAARGSLFTVNLLGKAVFRGLRDPAVLAFPIQLDMTAIYLYSGLHLIISLIIGLIVSTLVDLSERKQGMAGIALFVIIAGFFITILAVGLLTDQIRFLLPWWSIAIANTFAVVIAGSYIIKKHPGIWQSLNPFTR